MAFLDKTGLERLWLHIISNLNKKVDKVDGKGLSTNDYTTEDKARLATLDTLVGDTSVADQINTAIDTKADVSHTHDIEDINDYYGVIRKTGDIVSANSLEGLAIHPITHIEPVQEGSGDPSPDNVRAISGWDKVSTTDAGKNLLNLTTLTRRMYQHVVPAVYDNEINLAVNNASGGFQQWYAYMDIPESWRDQTLTFNVGTLVNENATQTTPAAFVVQQDADGKDVANYSIWSFPGAVSLEIKNNAKSMYFLFRADQDRAAEVGKNVRFGNIQLEFGDTATVFEPYQGQTLTTDLPETVYGGKLDWNTGILTVDKAKVTFDGETQGHKMDATDPNRYDYAYIYDVNLPLLAKGSGKAIANKAKWVSITQAGTMVVNVPAEVSGAIEGDSYTDVTAKINTVLKQWYDAGTPLEVVYEIANPVEYQLTPQQLTTIEGINNIWSNAGKTEALINLTYVNTDASLTSANTPANAKAVGDALAGKQPIGDYALKNEIPSIPVQSVNNKTGAVTLTASDVGADASGSANTALTNAKAYTDAEIAEWVGDKTVSVQINSAVSTKADAEHTHTAAQVGALDADDYYGIVDKTDNIVTFNSLEKLSIHPTTYIAPVQAGSGDPSPDNVRPISGWDSVTVQRTGKNLIPARFGKGRALGMSGGKIVEYGAENVYIIRDILLPPGTYTLSGPATAYVYIYDENLIANQKITRVNGVPTPYTFTLSSYAYMGVSGNEEASKVYQLESTSTATAYEPYEDQTLSASLPETVYGGTLDWGTGLLTVTHKNRIIDSMPRLYESIDSSAVVAGAMYIADMRVGGRTDGWCDALPSKPTPAWVTSPGITFGAGSSDLYVVLPSDRAGTTLESLNAYLAANPLNIVYPLAEPYTIQLSPQQLETLKGVNNVWSNSGMTRVLGNLTLTDPTLTLPNMAADAKAVGDVINAITTEYATNADWKVNDETSPAYVKNRTHWSEVSESTIIDNLSLTLTNNNGFYMSQPIECSATLNMGDICTVIWDNISYTCPVTATMYPDNMLAILIGNSSFVGGQDSGEPFMVQIMNGLMTFGCNTLPTTPSLTIISTVETVHKLDSKYIELPSVSKNILDCSYCSVRTIGSMEEDNTYKMGSYSFAEGIGTKAGNQDGSVSGVHAEGYYTTASGSSSHAEGHQTTASGNCSHAEGDRTKATGDSSHAEGCVTEASADYSHAEGRNTTASEDCSHAEGSHTTASGYCSHSEGCVTEASGSYSHAEGHQTTANYYYAHAEGYQTKATGEAAHAEGYNTEASGYESHAEGTGTKAIGLRSHAEGYGTVANKENSHAEGYDTIASGYHQHVQGKYNVEDTAGKYAHIVGNGDGSSTRSNAHTLDWDGNAWFQGSVYVGGTGQTDTAAVKLVTQTDMESYINETFLGGAW